MSLKVAILGALALSVLLLCTVLIQRSKNRTSRINLDDLVLGEDGTISRAAIVLLGSFVVATYIVVYQALHDKLSDTSFGLYLGTYAIPAVTKLIANAISKTPPVTTQETVISSTTVTPSK